MKNLALMGVLIRFNDDSWQWLTFLGHPVDVGLISRNSEIVQLFSLALK